MSRSPRTPGEVLASSLGHDFDDTDLLRLALSHASWAREQDGSRGNERLEFLGDAVLDLVVSHALFVAHPGWSEAQLSRTRASLVNGRSLADRARKLGLGDYVLLGGAELQSRGEEKDSILANVLEAVIAAVYLDGGLETARSLIRGVFPEGWDPGAATARLDPKSELNEVAHTRSGESPRYRLLADSGDEEAEERFTMEVSLDGRAWGTGTGRTKRAGETNAARVALERLAAEPDERLAEEPGD
jgi:ribonuclease-3